MTTSLVTVFGGTGFLGRQIVHALEQQGHAVRIAVRHPLTSASPTPQVEADVRDTATVARAVTGATAVINAVACYVERGTDTFQSIHVDGARTVAREAFHAGVGRCILISGIGANLASTSAYVRARGRGEVEFCNAFPTASIVRPSALFGGGDALLRSFDALLRASPVVPLFGSGQSRLQPVYVDDVALAVSRLAATPASSAEVFELGGPEVLSYRELLQRIQTYRGIRRTFVPIPLFVWSVLARLLSVLPAPPLTVDQIELVREDNVVGDNALGFADIGIAPRAIDELLGRCLSM